MSRAISIDGVLPLDLARARACPAKMLGAGVKSDCSAPALRVWRHARGTALGMGARDDRARQLGARPTVVQTDTFARASSWGRYRQRARERCKQRPRVTSKARVTKCYQAFGFRNRDFRAQEICMQGLAKFVSFASALVGCATR